MKRRANTPPVMYLTPPTAVLPDRDRDGVPDILDCQPSNPRKCGFWGDVSARLRSAWQRAPVHVSRERAASRRATVRRAAVSTGRRVTRRATTAAREVVRRAPIHISRERAGRRREAVVRAVTRPLGVFPAKREQRAMQQRIAKHEVETAKLKTMHVDYEKRFAGVTKAPAAEVAEARRMQAKIQKQQAVTDKTYTAATTAQEQYKAARGEAFWAPTERKVSEYIPSLHKISEAGAPFRARYAKPIEAVRGVVRAVPVPKPVHEFVSGVVIGGYEEFKRKPVTTVATVAAFAAVPPALKGVKWGLRAARVTPTVAKIPVIGKPVVKYAEPAIGAIMGTAYAGQVGMRVAAAPTPYARGAVIGGVVTTELAPMALGARIGVAAMRRAPPLPRVRTYAAEGVRGIGIDKSRILIDISKRQAFVKLRGFERGFGVPARKVAIPKPKKPIDFTYTTYRTLRIEDVPALLTKPLRISPRPKPTSPELIFGGEPKPFMTTRKLSRVEIAARKDIIASEARAAEMRAAEIAKFKRFEERAIEGIVEVRRGVIGDVRFIKKKPSGIRMLTQEEAAIFRPLELIQVPQRAAVAIVELYPRVARPRMMQATAYKPKPVTTQRLKMAYAPISIQAPAVIPIVKDKLIAIPAITERTMQEERLRMMPISLTKQIEKQIQEERLRVASISGQRMALRQIVDTTTAQVQIPALVQEVVPKVTEIIDVIPDVVIVTPKIVIPTIPKIPIIPFISFPEEDKKKRRRKPRGKRGMFAWDVKNPIRAFFGEDARAGKNLHSIVGR